MKTYKEITPIEALKRLAESGKPIVDMYFKDKNQDKWHVGILQGVALRSDSGQFILSDKEYNSSWWDQCAEVVEEAPKPWSFDTTPPRAVYRRKGYDERLFPVSQTEKGMTFFICPGGALYYPYHLLAEIVEYTVDGKTWKPCVQ